MFEAQDFQYYALLLLVKDRFSNLRNGNKNWAQLSQITVCPNCALAAERMSLTDQYTTSDLNPYYSNRLICIFLCLHRAKKFLCGNNLQHLFLYSVFIKHNFVKIKPWKTALNRGSVTQKAPKHWILMYSLFYDFTTVSNFLLSKIVQSKQVLLHWKFITYF